MEGYQRRLAVKYTIPAIHPLSQEETIMVLRSIMLMIKADKLRFHNEIYPRLNKTAQEVLHLAMELGFIEMDKSTLH